MPERLGMYAWENDSLVAYLTMVENATETERELSAQMFPPAAEGDPDVDAIYSEDDDGAHIRIAGPLMSSGPSPLMRLFGIGGTGYPAIVRACDRAEASGCDDVMFHFATPGGDVQGCDQTWQRMRALAKSKNVSGRIEGMCASAGYYLASAIPKGSLFATSPGDEIGSIGVKMVAIDTSGSEMEKAYGKRIQIISKNAPNKSDDVTNKTGRSALQDRVDAAERVFISRVADGRKVSEDEVRQNFGRGGLLLAKDPDSEHVDALGTGMIDKVVPFHADAPVVPDTSSRRAPGSWSMSALEAKASGKPDLQIVDKPWDVTAANKRWREYTKSDKDPSESYKDGFFWYDEKNPKKFESYKLQFVDIVDGKPAAIRKAIFASNGAMAGARGTGVNIPSSDRKAVQSKIDAYLKKIKADEGKAKKTKGSARAEGEQIMKLSEFLDENPEAMAELEGIKAQSFKAGRDSIITVAKTAAPIIGSAEYPQKIKDFAMKAIAGDITAEVFTSTVAMYDALKEDRKQIVAQQETSDIGETPAQKLEANTELLAEAAKYNIDVKAVQEAAIERKTDPVEALKGEIDLQKQMAKQRSHANGGGVR